jgi:hypothetical protein
MILCPLTRKSPCEVFGTHSARQRPFEYFRISAAATRIFQCKHLSCWAELGVGQYHTRLVARRQGMQECLFALAFRKLLPANGKFSAHITDKFPDVA